jgi:PAS domain S-box-containing protein
MSSATQHSTANERPIRLLWLEDNPHDVELLTRLLIRAGLHFTTTLARSGREYRAALTGEHDLILADYHLPDISGPEALAMAREVAPQLPVIFVSGSIGEERAIAAVRDGAVDYVLKDRPTRLPNAITRALRERNELAAHKRVEAEITQRFRHQFEQSPIAIFVWRAIGDDFEFMEYNAAAGRLSRDTAKELLGMKATVAYREHPEVLQAMRDCTSRQGSARLTIEYESRADHQQVLSDITIGFIQPDLLLFYTEDVTAARQSQRRIEFQSALLENVQNSIVATDHDGLVTYWNRSAELLFGWQRDEVMGRNILDFHVAHDAAAQTRDLLRVLPDRGRFEGEMTVVHKNGQPVPVFASISVASAETSGAPAFVAVYFDLTELRREQAARLENEALLSSVLEHLPVGIRITDPEGRTVRTNPAAMRMIGHHGGQRIEEYAGMTARWSATGQPVSDGEWPLNRAMRTLRPLMNLEIDITNVAGEERSLLASGVPILDSSAKLIAGLVVLHDVTERRRAVLALRQSEMRFRSLVENLSDVISILAADGTMLYHSPSVTSALGYTPEELRGRNIAEFLRPSETAVVMAQLADHIRTMDDTRRIALDLCNKDGSWRSFEVITSTIIEEGVSHLIATARDVTDRDRLARKLEQAQRVTGLGRVAAIIAHEINNVLMGILPFAEIVGARAGDDPHLQLASTQINRAMRRGRGITQEILRFTNSGNPTLHAVDLGNFFKTFEAEAHNLVAGRRLSIECDAKSLWINADADLITQMISNLLLNARDATTPSGNITLSCRQVSRGETFSFGTPANPEEQLHIEVRDDGIGMSEEVARHVFDPLFTTKSRGTGLGLSVVHQIIEAHGGQIFMKSAPGAGTSFHIFLPRVEQSQESAPLDAASSDPSHLGIKRVLIVDDDDSVALGLTMTLELEGFSVSTVGTAAAVIPEIEQFRPDLVLLDCGLPDGSGLNVFQDLSRLWPNLPVIFSTGEGDSEAVKLQASAPHVGYLSKPYDHHDLLTEMARVTRG